jgi:two-component system sensor histidine kinase BarA
VLGPFLPAEVTSVPDALLNVDPKMDHNRALELLPRMPRAKAEAISLICDHLRRTLDLILWSGHKALLTSQMHLSSVRESYRELQTKNEKLQEAFDRLRELDRLKSNFLGVVSHELRTPLTSIIGYSEMLVEGIAGPLVGDQQKFVQTINDKGQQLLQLIMSLLDLSKLESGTISMKKGTVVIEQLLGDVAATLAPKARKRSIDIAVAVDPGLPEVQGDPDRLRQVFVNLVDNAVKFSPDGGTVTVAARRKTGAVEVRVVDRGPGIPAAERARIFRKFYRGDFARDQPGSTGLGLFIAEGLVRAMGGRIWVDSEEGEGSSFTFELPLAVKQSEVVV